MNLRTSFGVAAALVLGASVFGCGDDGAGGSGGTGGSGGGTGGSGGNAAMCPATPGDAPCDMSNMVNDGLRCEYAEAGCPTFRVCVANSATHGGWLVRPPEDGATCATAGQTCAYEDPNFDSGMTTVWTATCTGGTWAVVETTEPNG